MIYSFLEPEDSDKEEEGMSNNYGYRETNKKNKRGFTPDINPEVNTMLDIYCRINNKNKTHLVNEVLNSWLKEKFSRLREQ